MPCKCNRLSDQALTSGFQKRRKKVLQICRPPENSDSNCILIACYLGASNGNAPGVTCPKPSYLKLSNKWLTSPQCDAMNRLHLGSRLSELRHLYHADSDHNCDEGIQRIWTTVVCESWIQLSNQIGFAVPCERSLWMICQFID